MTKPPGPTPKPNPERAAREAAALRTNLQKRKDQARRREATKQQPEQPGNRP